MTTKRTLTRTAKTIYSRVSRYPTCFPQGVFEVVTERKGSHPLQTTAAWTPQSSPRNIYSENPMFMVEEAAVVGDELLFCKEIIGE